jgi:hypothetical protein
MLWQEFCARSGLARWRNGWRIDRQLHMPQDFFTTLVSRIAAMIRSVPC